MMRPTGMTLQGVLRFSSAPLREPLLDGSGLLGAGGQPEVIAHEVRHWLQDYGTEGRRIRITVELVPDDARGRRGQDQT